MHLSKFTGLAEYRDTSVDYVHVSYSKHQPPLSVGWCKSIDFIFLFILLFCDYIILIVSFYIVSHNMFLIYTIDTNHSSMYCGASKMMSIVIPKPTMVWPELIRIRRLYQDLIAFRAQVCTLTTMLHHPYYSKWLRVRHVNNPYYWLSITRKKERENYFIIQELFMEVAVSFFCIRVYRHNEYLSICSLFEPHFYIFYVAIENRC